MLGRCPTSTRRSRSISTPRHGVEGGSPIWRHEAGMDAAGVRRVRPGRPMRCRPPGDGPPLGGRPRRAATTRISAEPDRDPHDRVPSLSATTATVHAALARRAEPTPAPRYRGDDVPQRRCRRPASSGRAGRPTRRPSTWSTPWQLRSAGFHVPTKRQSRPPSPSTASTNCSVGSSLAAARSSSTVTSTRSSCSHPTPIAVGVFALPSD